MGTCLATGRSVVIDRTDHFLAQNTVLTCSAHRSSTCAVVARGAGYFRLLLQPQSHTLALVEMAAQNVENRTLLSACKDLHLARFHRCAEFVSTGRGRAGV